MKRRSRNLSTVRFVRFRVIAVVLLLSVIPYGLSSSGKFASAAAGTSTSYGEGVNNSVPQQALALPITHQHSKKSEMDTSWKIIRMRVTGYCPCRKCCGKCSDGITANGHRIVKGDEFVAADRKHSFGTKVIVPGYNNSMPVEVLDRGRAIKGNRIDVFFDSHAKARQWGVRYLPVRVLIQ